MRRIALVLSVAAVVAMLMVIAAPAMAQGSLAIVAIQEDKEKMKEDPKMKEEMKKEEEKKKDLPKSGGISGSDAALLGLGASALLVGGGLLVRRVVR